MALGRGRHLIGYALAMIGYLNCRRGTVCLIGDTYVTHRPSFCFFFTTIVANMG